MSLLRAPSLLAFRRARAWLVALVIVTLTGAAEAPRKTFNVPAAPAEDSVPMLADQAGINLGFNVQHVQGIRTKSVKGRFTVAEALEQLLSGSPLNAVRDAQTGAFFVNRKPPPRPK
jgi:iron complex outermembrane recepter protein